MRSYLACSLLVVLLAVTGCGDSKPATDARDTASDRMDGGGSNDRGGAGGAAAGAGGAAGNAGGAGGAVAGSGGAAGTSGGSGGSAGAGGTNDGGAVDAPDADPDGGGDGGGTPTCNDGIKNSDETGVDCGGHCGKCAPGNDCLVDADCQFSCRADKTCAACNVAADCAGVESECEHRTCTAGVCGSAREAAGKVLVVQTTGDCKRRQCAADGSVANVNDDTDVKDDRNPCTNDICTSGVPSQTLMPENSNCGGANRCNASGQCIGCTVPADCPGTDTTCRARTCTAGVCGFNFTAAGHKLVDPTAGDCKGMQCDGAGNSQVVTDNTDLPVDGNVCTTDECSAGTPSHRPVSSGINCGGSLVCDGASKCVQCLSASTCPGTDAECHTRSCIAGQCGTSHTANGTLVAAQTPRDCKKTVCDGQGATVIVPDGLDLPVDGNPCTQDVCTAGTPSNPFVSAGNSCGATTVCDGQGACVTCLSPSSCPGTDTDCRHRTCTNGACGMATTADGIAVQNQTAGDCKKTVCMSGAPMVINDNLDLPVDGNLCTSDVCTAGTPTNPNVASGTACGPSLMCNGQGACVGCLTATDCGTNTTCQTHTCTNGTCGVNNAPTGTLLPTQTGGDCKKVQCDGQGQQQTVDDDTDVPVDTNSCTQDLCSAGLPSHPPVAAGTACDQNNGTKCNGSGTAPACVQCLAASECPGGPDTECRTRTCTNGVCGFSNTADGTEVTSQTGGDCKKTVCMGGSPTPIDDNTDVPVDGNGCTLDLCNAGVPMNQPRPANAPCSEDGGTRCNGSTSMPACVQCLTAADCGNDIECQKFACSATGQCMTNNVDNGTPLILQMPGDCKTATCNGIGGTTTIVNSTDVPVDGNPCTFDICTNDVPSNPPRSANAPCSQGSGTRCNGSPTTPACVECLTAAHCGTDTACRTYACSATGTCSFSDANDGALVTNVPAGDCHKDVCMSGAIANVVDNTDVDDDGNLCTNDLCMDGSPQHSNVNAGVSCGTGLMCNGLGACVGCLTEMDCPQPPNACQTRVCMNGTCGFMNVAVDVPVPTQTPGDCKQVLCDGAGDIKTVNDNGDLPVDGNACTQDLCTNGDPSNPPFAAGTVCSGPNGAVQCNGAGVCVQCTHPSQCPGGPDTDCHVVTCSGAGVCGISEPPDGTTVPTQTSGDCKRKVCNGTGGTRDVADDSDTPANNNECALAMCLGGEISTTNRLHGTSCTQNNGRTCDGSGSCLLTFNVVRVGKGDAPLTNNATAVFVEEWSVAGALQRTVPLPTAEASPNHAFALSGTASSLGNLTLSGDGRYVVLAGFNRAVGTSTTNVGNSSALGTNRMAASIDAMGNVDTTTLFGDSAFTGGNVRGAATNDGTGFWLTGVSTTIGNGGVWYAAHASPTGGTQVAMTGDSRCLGVFGGQLYGTSSTSPYVNVFTVGTGLPTTGSQAANNLPDMTSSGGPFSFVLFDRTSVPGLDTLYVADDGGSTTRGIQKWTKTVDADDGDEHWTRQAIFNFTPSTSAVGFHGVTGTITGGNMTLIANTAEGDTTPNRVVIFVETSPTTATASTLLTAPTNTFFRGVALSPHL